MQNSNGIDIQELRSLCKWRRIRWTAHIIARLIQRNISQDDVVAAIMKGRIIEQYPEDAPVPRCLILGMDTNGIAIHVCCCIYCGDVCMITAYRPDANKWSADFAARRNG